MRAVRNARGGPFREYISLVIRLTKTPYDMRSCGMNRGPQVNRGVCFRLISDESRQSAPHPRRRRSDTDPVSVVHARRQGCLNRTLRVAVVLDHICRIFRDLCDRMLPCRISRCFVKMIERVSKLSAAAMASADFSFTVFERALPPFYEEGLGKITTMPAYEKTYVRDDDLYVEPNDTCRMIATASVKGEAVGYVAVSRSWNGCAQIDEIMISRPHRGEGIGRARRCSGPRRTICRSCDWKLRIPTSQRAVSMSATVSS